MILGIIFAGCGASNANATSNLPEALAGDHDKYTTLDGSEVEKKAYVYLYRKDKKYHMGEIPKDEKVNIGLRNHSIDSNYILYNDTQILSIEKDFRIISMKDVPIPIIQKNDKIYLQLNYSSCLKIKPVKFIGYTPLIIKHNDFHVTIEEKNQILNPIRYFEELAVCTLDDKGSASSGNLSTDEIVTLKYGQKVAVDYKDKKTHKWQGCDTYATCSYYEPTGDYLEFNPTEKVMLKDKEHAIYDPTQLEEGFYALFDSVDVVQSVFYVPANVQ